MSTTDDVVQVSSQDAPATKQKLVLQVKVTAPQTCLRHVIVTIPRAEVDRYVREAYDNLAPQAAVPGFRAGRAPRKLVERHFREKVDDQVKGSLIMESLGQVTEEQTFSAISEPDFDFKSITLPTAGDFTYEFKVEVRPEFETPNWKSLPLVRQIESIAETDVDRALKRILERYSVMQATDQAAEEGDTLLLNISTSFEGVPLTVIEEVKVNLRPVLSFLDGRCDDFGKKLEGAKEGETRTATIRAHDGLNRDKLSGADLHASFEVVEVLRNEPPDLTHSFLKELGDFESEVDLRTFVRESLERQADYRQRDDLRGQVVTSLTANANWELPPELVRKQTRRELERKGLELRRSGFDDQYIQQVLNMMRQNAKSATEQALREHFILEQIAENEKVEASSEDFDHEIKLIASQSDMPARRVRARLEKSGQIDALRNQIIERKVIEMIAAAATMSERQIKHQTPNEENETALNESAIALKIQDEIPEAKYDDSTKKEEPLPGVESET